MEQQIYFIKVNQFHSSKKEKDYYTIEYLTVDGLEYYKEFITKEQYDKIYEELELEALEECTIVYKLGNNKTLVYSDIKTE